MNKKDKLSKLRSEIIDKIFKNRWEEVWFYPSYNEVKGWQGTADIMFIGLNPATANFGGFHDLLYYDSLKRFGFRNAHLTDIFKIKLTNKNTRSYFERRDVKREARDILEKEINIIKPKVIYLLGDKVEEIFKEFFPKLKIPIKNIGHYSYRYKSRDILKKRWMEIIRNLSEEIATN